MYVRYKQYRQRTVTIRFKLPDSRLKSTSYTQPADMNTSQGIYGGIGGAVVDRC